jgi:hypothetical protein
MQPTRIRLQSPFVDGSMGRRVPETPAVGYEVCTSRTVGATKGKVRPRLILEAEQAISAVPAQGDLPKRGAWAIILVMVDAQRCSSMRGDERARALARTKSTIAQSSRPRQPPVAGE